MDTYDFVPLPPRRQHHPYGTLEFSVECHPYAQTMRKPLSVNTYRHSLCRGPCRRTIASLQWGGRVRKSRESMQSMKSMKQGIWRSKPPRQEINIGKTSPALTNTPVAWLSEPRLKPSAIHPPQPTTCIKRSTTLTARAFPIRLNSFCSACIPLYEGPRQPNSPFNFLA